MNHPLPLSSCGALEALYDSLNGILKILPTSGDFSVFDNAWTFKDHKRLIHTIDFSYFNDLIFTEYQKNELTYNDEVLIIGLRSYVKLLFLHSIKSTHNASTYSNRLDVLKMLFTFLVQSKLRVIDELKLKEFYSILLTCDLSKGQFVKRYKAPAYKVRLIHFNELHLIKLTNRFKSRTFIEKGLIGNIAHLRNSVCKITLGMSFHDYIDGGSFDFLGLEIGKYYVDHCSTIFDEHSIYSMAVNKTLANYEAKYNSGISNYGTYGVHFIANTLLGLDKKEINAKHKYKHKHTSDKTIDSYIEFTKSTFVKYYNKYLSLFNAGKTSFINEVLALIGIPDRFDNQEFVRSLMFSVVNANTKSLKLIESQIEEYRSILKATGTPLKVSTKEIIQIISDTLKQGTINKSDVSRICLEHNERLNVLSPVNDKVGPSLLYFLIRTVESAGMTIFLALTGWRASEYGFPLASIKLSLNIEPKDNAYTPFRFHVNWVVPKTSGNTKLNREITLSSYLIAQQLHHINNSNENAPCLFKVTNGKILDQHQSQAVLKSRVLKAWSKFPFEYELFKGLDLKNNSLALEALSKSELESLKVIRSELRDSIPQFNFMYSKKNGNDTTGKKLKAYRKGSLNQLESKVIENNLSEDTLKKLRGESEFTRATVNAISAELRSELVYPTPHAFRHMWAEAVLLRYRGDVGKFIRANFKHIDERFFVAYLRNKETKMIVDLAKRSVINKIVRQQMLAVKDKDATYVGGFNRFITKAVSLTHVFTHEEFIKKAESIAEQRIVDIKINAWATCMLRVGTFNTAKCSVDGVPQRFNASPKLCLGCTNANIAEGNYNGIVVYTQQEVKALRNPELPYFIKRDYIQTVQHALKRVKELNKKKGKTQYLKFIEYLEESIQMAEKSKKEADHG